MTGESLVVVLREMVVRAVIEELDNGTPLAVELAEKIQSRMTLPASSTAQLENESLVVALRKALETVDGKECRLLGEAIKDNCELDFIEENDVRDIVNNAWSGA